MRQNNEHRNINMLLMVAFSIITFIIISIRAFQLSVVKEVNDVNLVQIYEDEINRSSITSANRGSIFDNNGHPIAMDTTSYSLYAILGEDGYQDPVDEPDYVAKRLSKYLNLSQEEILDKLLTDNVYQIEFGSSGRKLSKEVKEQIESENLTGIYFSEETKRTYVNDYFASHLLGYSSVDNELSKGLNVDIQKGKMGLELEYDDELSGIEAFKNRDSNGEKENYLSGEDLYLTIDSRLQNYLEDLLNNAYITYKPEQMMGYLVEVKTGKVIAASQRPSFNLNTLEGVDKEWKNLLVEEVYEPGSTIKILTLASAYQNKLYYPGELFTSGKINVYDQTVHDYNKYGWGDITYEDALIRSSNVGMVKLIEKMGVDRWKEELNKYGFGKSTESGLANESTGNIKFSNPVNAIMSGFGQGFSATPIQLLQAYSSVGNQGEMLKLQFVNGVGANNQFSKKSLGQVMDSQTATHILETMKQSTIDPYGTATMFYNPNVSIAAKTGTAEIANLEKSGYLKGKNNYLYSVISFFPAEDPEYMLYMAIKQPQTENNVYGMNILSEVFNKFVDNIIISNIN